MTITDELLAPSGATLKFEAEGDIHKIRITAIEKRQTTDFVSGEPATWDDGNPKNQWVIAGISNGEDAKIYIKDWGNQKKAFVDALVAAGIKAGDSIEGGTLTVKWDSTDAPSRAGLSGAKVFKMRFEPAPAAVVDDDLI